MESHLSGLKKKCAKSSVTREKCNEFRKHMLEIYFRFANFRDFYPLGVMQVLYPLN